MGKKLEFKYPDLAEFEIYGTEDIEDDELYTPPPFMDLEKFLEPVYIQAIDFATEICFIILLLQKNNFRYIGRS